MNMKNSENIKLAADHKREEAKRKLASMFRISYPLSSETVNSLVDDIISAAILEIASIQAKASESNAELVEQNRSSAGTQWGQVTPAEAKPPIGQNS